MGRKRAVMMVMRLVPLLSMRLVMLLVAPLPMAMSATTAATPMTMPRMVSAERSLLAVSPRKAVRKFCEINMVYSLC